MKENTTFWVAKGRMVFKNPLAAPKPLWKDSFTDANCSFANIPTNLCGVGLLFKLPQHLREPGRTTPDSSGH